MLERKLRLYIAGPITKGDQLANVRRAIEIGNDLAQAGFAVYIPHLNALWHLLYPQGKEFWYSHDNEWLLVCDAVFRLKGESVGADAEVALAREHGIAVYEERPEGWHGIRDLLEAVRA